MSFIGIVSLHHVHRQYQAIFPVLRMMFITVFVTPQDTAMTWLETYKVVTHYVIVMVNCKILSRNSCRKYDSNQVRISLHV